LLLFPFLFLCFAKPSLARHSAAGIARNPTERWENDIRSNLESIDSFTPWTSEEKARCGNWKREESAARATRPFVQSLPRDRLNKVHYLRIAFAGRTKRGWVTSAFARLPGSFLRSIRKSLCVSFVFTKRSRRGIKSHTELWDAELYNLARISNPPKTRRRRKKSRWAGLRSQMRRHGNTHACVKYRF